MAKKPLTQAEHNSRVITYTLSFVIVAMVLVFLAGLFDTNVDNAEVFKTLGPAFSGIAGYFIGRGDRKDG